MPNHGLSRAYRDFVSVLSKHHFNSFGFTGIVHLGAGAVSIDIINLLNLYLGILQGSTHGISFGFRSRSSCIVGIERPACAGNFSQDGCTPLPGMFIAFQNNYSSTLGIDETVPVVIEWATSLGRVRFTGKS